MPLTIPKLPIPLKDSLEAFIQHSQELFLRTQDTIFPAFCHLCDKAVCWPLKGGICGSCLKQIPKTVRGCSKCGAEIPAAIFVDPSDEKLTEHKDRSDNYCRHSISESGAHLRSERRLWDSDSPNNPKSKGCGNCRQGKWPARRIYAFGTYGGTLQKILVSLKSPGSESVAIALGTAMTKWLQEQIALASFNPQSNSELTGQFTYDAIVSTPKFWMRRVSQRHNSAELLAETIGLGMGIPVWTNGVFQTRATSKQGVLLPNQRKQNVQDAFAVNPRRSWLGKRVLVVDDIVTSGSTMAEIANVLKRAKVSVVDGFCAARGTGSAGK